MEYKSRKYLNDIGAFPVESEIIDNTKRTEQFEKQRETYGFDERETWSLDFTMRVLLYERLKMYLEMAEKVTNLDYHKVVYNGKEYSQYEMIVYLIDILEKIIEMTEDSVLFSAEESEKYVNLCEEVWDVWKVLEHFMWW